MRYTRIEILGDANIFATLTRKSGPTIEIEILRPDGNDSLLTLNANDPEARWSMAKRLQQTLDGVARSGGDIRDYTPCS
jgi:hypothetical protein